MEVHIKNETEFYLLRNIPNQDLEKVKTNQKILNLKDNCQRTKKNFFLLVVWVEHVGFNLTNLVVFFGLWPSRRSYKLDIWWPWIFQVQQEDLEDYSMLVHCVKGNFDVLKKHQAKSQQILCTFLKISFFKNGWKSKSCSLFKKIDAN